MVEFLTTLFSAYLGTFHYRFVLVQCLLNINCIPSTHCSDIPCTYFKGLTRATRRLIEKPNIRLMMLQLSKSASTLLAHIGCSCADSATARSADDTQIRVILWVALRRRSYFVVDDSITEQHSCSVD